MKLCVFQGTFNPIHKAHLLMANYIIKHFSFDKIIFIPAYMPPHKDSNNKMAYHRLNMVRLAVQNNPDFECSDIEFRREGKSYTYHTILELYKELDIDGKIKFIIGTDAFEKIESWFEADKLKNLVEFIVFKRSKSYDENTLDYLKVKGYNFVFSDMNFEDISSTEIRNYILSNKDISSIVTSEVEEYIKKNDLYKD